MHFKQHTMQCTDDYFFNVNWKISRNKKKFLREREFFLFFFLPSAESAQQLGASSVSFTPSGSDMVSDRMTVWPADAVTGGKSFLAADLGSVGTLVTPKGFTDAESVHSVEMWSWSGDRFRYSH